MGHNVQACVLAALLVATAAPASRSQDDPKNWSWDLKSCLVSASWETTARACNAAIEAGTGSAANRARAHLNRAGRRIETAENGGVRVAYDIDRAIADFTEAIRLDPTLAEAFANRAHALEQQGAFDRALSDYDDAIRLIQNPGVRSQYEAWRAAARKRRDARENR